jgi:hypothetical protein
MAVRFQEKNHDKEPESAAAAVNPTVAFPVHSSDHSSEETVTAEALADSSSKWRRLSSFRALTLEENHRATQRDNAARAVETTDSHTRLDGLPLKVA